MTARTVPEPVPSDDRDLAAIAELVGDATRIVILAELTDGRARPAGELARIAGVHPATVSVHLRRLVEGGLVRVTTQGRHRYHELAEPDVATAVEALARLAPVRPVRSLRQQRSTTVLHEARTCYDHLAGRRGVELRERLLDEGAVRPAAVPDDLETDHAHHDHAHHDHAHHDRADHVLTDHGERLVRELGLDPDLLHRGRRVFARSCLDVTHRRPHLAGSLPSALTRCFLDRGWLARGRGRAVTVSDDYDRQLDRWLASVP